MKKLALVGVAVALTAALVYWFGFRDRGATAARPGAVAKGEPDPWDAPAKARAADKRAADRPAGPMPKMAFEVDPEGHLLLEGQVLDEQDHPVAGAEVRLSAVPARTTKTDTDGSFSFDKVLGRTYTVNARSGDKIGRAVAKVTASRGDPVVIRLRQGASLTVTVTDAADQRPIAGARVMRLDDGEQGDEATTDGSGRAVLRGIEEGWVSVAATAPGYGPSTSSKGVGGDKQVSIDVALTKGPAVGGRVVDEQGQPIAGARVWAMDAANAWEGGAGERVAQTSAKDGSFTIPALAPGSYTLHAKDERHAPAVTPPVQVVAGAPTTGLEVVMKEAAVVAGVVVGTDGAPVPYATVKIASTRWSPDMTNRQAAADDQGAFEIKGLARAALRMRAEGDEASSAAVDVDLVATPVKRDVRLVLDRAGTIAGVVVDGDGEPVPEATVSAYPDFMAGEVADGDWVMASNGTATTDGDGRFVLKGLEDGAFRVWAARDSGGSRRNTGREGVATRTGAKDVRLVLPAPGGIHGKLALEDGAPPVLAIVSADWQHRVTVRDGAFDLVDLQPGTYDLRIVGNDFAERIKSNLEVTAGKVTDAGTITLRRGRKLAGTVVDGKGAPIAGARVVFGKLLFGDGKQTGADDAESAAQMGMKVTTTGADGSFLITGAPRTSGSLLAEHPALGRSVAIKIAAGKDDLQGVALALRGYGSVTGKVTRKGEPVGGATVNAAPMGSSGQAIFVQTGQDGSFAIDRVAEGPTSISVLMERGMGGVGGSRTVTVVAGKATDGSLVLPAGDLTLALEIKPRAGDVVNAAQAFLFRGVVAARTGEQIMDVFLASGGTEAAQGETTVAVGGAAGMVIWLGGAGPKFEDLLPGSYSACVIPITGSIMDQQLMQRIFRNLDKLEVYCQPVTVKAAPALQQLTMTVPAMTPLPTEDDE